MTASTTPHKNFFLQAETWSQLMSSGSMEATGRVNCMKGAKFSAVSAMLLLAALEKAIKSKRRKHFNLFL
jgi:hypothetical protein